MTAPVGLEFNLDTDIADDDHAKFMVDGQLFHNKSYIQLLQIFWILLMCIMKLEVQKN